MTDPWPYCARCDNPARCHDDAHVYDTDGTPHCTTHMPTTDPAIAAAIRTLTTLDHITIVKEAS